MMLAAPELVITERVDLLDEIEVAAELNARPRKTLGMNTPADMMQQLLFGPLAPTVATTA